MERIKFSEYLLLRKRNNPKAIEKLNSMDAITKETYEHYANMIDGGGAVYPTAHSKGGD